MNDLIQPADVSAAHRFCRDNADAHAQAGKCAQNTGDD